MSKPRVTYPDVEIMVVDFLTPLFSDLTVGIPVPAEWVKTKAGEAGSPNHIQVAVDATDMRNHPVSASSVVRITVWAQSATMAKSTANTVQSWLTSTAEFACEPLTGIVGTLDPDTRADLATFTVRVSVRSETT